MKKVLALLLVLILAAAGAQSTAFAASQPRDRMSWSVVITPQSLTGPGTVELELTLTNNGDPVRNVVLHYPDSTRTAELGDIPSGETITHENKRWEITEAMLGEPLTFELSWESQNGSEHTKPFDPITIGRADADLNVKAEAKVDKVHVDEGEKVQFTFTFENQGNVEVTDAYLEAPPLNNGEPLGDNFSVSPGDTNTKTWSPTINQEITVRPVYTYTVDGEQRTLACDPLTVRIGEGGPELQISIQSNVNRVAPGGEVEFEVAIENTGTIDIDDISVRDSQGGTVSLSQTSLTPGASASGTETVTVDETTSYVFFVSGAAQGEAVTAESTPIDITADSALGTPAPAQDLDAASIVQIDVSVVTQVQRAGVVPVEVTVKNLSAEELTNIVVSAEVSTAGGAAAAQSVPALETTAAAAGLEQVTIGTLPSLAAGTNQVIEGTLEIQQTANYVFRVSAEMPDGTLVTSETGSATIELREAGGLEMWQWIVIAAVALAVILAVILIVRSKRKPATTTRKAPAKRASSQKPPRPSSTMTATGSAAASQKYREAEKAKQKPAAADAKESRTGKTAPVSKKPALSKKTPPQPRYGDRNKF
ncbi:MAG: hypothetical protein HDQ87_09355 [Clostridia bacterium]|nr:hypothetical protein [Clostridia bacterium]